jgi:DNA-binding response OmpR family regulator
MSETVEKRRILIVDDDPAVRASLEDSLSENYETKTAGNESDGIALARSYRPDLILLDVDLGKDSGVNVCFSLKNDPVTARIPVLILTGIGSDPVRELARIAGASEYLEKPITPNELRERVASRLNRPDSSPLTA